MSLPVVSLLKRLSITAVLCGFSMPVFSLQSLDDEELGDVTGQAVVNMVTDSINDAKYTRVNLGIDVSTQLNVDEVKLGTRIRDGVEGSDIDIDNLALGYISDNGTGEIVPFRVRDPYVEFAYEGDGIAGVRIGFNEAKGFVSGDINQLTGNIAVGISGTIDELADATDNGLVDFTAAFFDSPLTAEAGFVNPDGTANNVRATMVGMTNGSAIAADSGVLDFLLGILSSDGCEAAGLPTCFDLGNFRSLPIGNMNIADDPNTDTIEGASRGFFISLGHQDIQWRDLEDPSNIIDAPLGAFVNVPKYRDENGNLQAPINVNFTQVFQGIERLATCYQNAGAGAVGC